MRRRLALAKPLEGGNGCFSARPKPCHLKWAINIDDLPRSGDRAAAIVGTTRRATCNGAAVAMLPEDLRTVPVLFPSADILARGEWFAAQSAASQRLRDRLWTEIKT